MTVNMKVRNIPWILMTVFMISAMVYSATAIRAASAAAQKPSVFVDPPQTVLTEGVVNVTTFQVNVTIANVTGVAGIQFRFEWNASLLKITNFKEVFFHTLTPEASFSNIWSIKLSYNNTAGFAEYGQTWQDLGTAQIDGYAPGNVTTGKLAVASFTFQVLQVPPNAAAYYDCDFTAKGVIVGDLDGNAMDITVSNGYYRIYGPPETSTFSIQYNSQTYNVTTVTNASAVPGSMTFTKVNDSDYELNFNLTGADGTTGYVNVTVPKSLMSVNSVSEWNATINGVQTTPTVTQDDTNWYLYIVTNLSTKSVTIIGTIPEFTLLVAPLLMAATLIAVGLRRRKQA